MFDQVFVTDTGARIRPGALAASLAGEMAVVAAAVLIPLLFTEALPQRWWRAYLLEPSPPGRPVKVEPAGATIRKQGRAPRPAATARLYEPVKYPPTPAIVVDEVGDVPRLAWVGEGVGVVGGIGIPGVPGSPVIDEALRYAPEPPAPAAKAPARIPAGFPPRLVW